MLEGESFHGPMCGTRENRSRSLLDVLVEVDSQKHPEETEEVDFQDEAEGELEEDQVDRQRGIDAGSEVAGEYRLNGTLRSHDSEDFSQYSAQESTDEHENEQNPG